MNERVRISIEAAVAQVTLERPDKHNALDLAMFQAIVSAQKTLAASRGLRAVVLSGAGPDFCSGLDVKSVLGNRRDGLKLMWKWLPWRANLAQRVSTGWRQLSVPVIAAIHGRCWGGGLQIALGADFRIVHPGVSLSVMEGKWGLIPDMGGTLALRDLMPRDQATRLAMTAEEIDAPRALELGLVTAIADDPVATAMTWAETVKQRSPDAVAAVKRLYLKSWGGAGRVLARESAYQLRVMAGANQRIAVRRARGEQMDYKPHGQ